MSYIMDDLYIKYMNKLKDEKTNISGNIFHYTSPNGFKGILENNKLWFSNIEYLNDEEELFYTYNIVLKLAKKMIKDNSTEFLDKIIEYFENIVNKREKIFYGNFYTCCFSLDNDNLATWNYYTKNENSLGFNIEFDVSIVNEIIRKFQVNQYFWAINGKVIYEPEIQEKFIKESLRDFNDAYIKNNNNRFIKEFLISHYISLIDMFSLFFKYPKFDIEKEYRIVCAIHDANKEKDIECPYPLITRVQNNIIVPYFEMPFEKRNVKSVMISPTNKDNLVNQSLNQFFEINKYTNVEIKHSDIPLRY